MLEKLNCNSCGQNVMVSGLKSVDNVWKCRECIKLSGTDLTNTNAILVYDTPTTPLSIHYKTREMILKDIESKG